MTLLELKAIKHCEKQLNDIDTHMVYSKTNDALLASGCTIEQTRSVLNALSTAQSLLINRVAECKSWLTELLKS